MDGTDLDLEIEKLKEKMTELKNKMKFTRDSFDKEDLQMKIATIDQQIQTLEKFKIEILKIISACLPA